MKKEISKKAERINYPISFILVFYLPISLFGQVLHPFSIGERLEYKAKFGFINLGKMVLEIADTSTIDGKLCYKINSFLNSNPALGFIFSLNDTISVFSTVENLFPILYEKRVHERKYTNYQKLRFNQDSLWVIINDSASARIEKEARDLLSFWYYLRKIPLIENDTVNLIIFEGRENHHIECLIGKKETLKTSLGKFSTIRVSPKTTGKGVFGPSGRMDIWYSNDSLRIPLQIKTRLKFGTVVFKIKRVEY